MSMSFEDAYRAQVQQLPPSFSRRRHLHILSLPAHNWRRQHALLFMEGKARDHLGVGPDVDVDWSEGSAVGAGTVNWANILKLLETLLPLILAFFGL